MDRKDPADAEPLRGPWRLFDALMALAEKGEYHPMLTELVSYTCERPDGRHGRQRRDRKRWSSYDLKVRGVFRKNADVATLIWGASMVALLDRAVEGGRRATIHLSHGRRRPRRNATRIAVDLLRQSGLKADIQRHRAGSTEILVRF